MSTDGKHETTPDLPISTTTPNGRAMLTAIGAAVLFVREMTPDPEQRLRLVRRLSAGMAAVVNDDSWGTGFSK